MVGQVMWELIEPLDEDGIYARFLAEKGEGIHHVAVATPDFDESVARAEQREDGVMLSCKHSGIDIAYLDTLGDLGVSIEIFSGTPGAEREPDAISVDAPPPVPQYYRQGKPMEGESRWES